MLLPNEEPYSTFDIPVLVGDLRIEFQRSHGAATSDGTTVLAFPTSMSCRIFFTCRNTAQLPTIGISNISGGQRV